MYHFRGTIVEFDSITGMPVVKFTSGEHCNFCEIVEFLRGYKTTIDMREFSIRVGGEVVVWTLFVAILY
jgi:hypothetical protein